MKKIITILTEMKMLAIQIEAKETARMHIPSDGQRFGNTAAQIGDMVANAKEDINADISAYRALSKKQFELLRKFEIRDSKPIEYTFGNPWHFPATVHNRMVEADQIY